MTWKRDENVLETRAYIKGRSLPCTMPVDIHREVCNIYGVGQISHSTKVFVGWYLNLGPDSSNSKMLLAQVVQQQLRRKVTSKKSAVC